MNTTLNPVTTQTSSAAPNKPMHPQGAPVSYGQPSGPLSQNPYPNTNMAHNHPPSQQNHYSLSGGSPFNMGAIPASNHPVANNQSSGQVYNAPKNVSYSSGFQNTQNQNTLPPVVQTLPATAPSASTPQQNVSSSTQNLSNSNSNSTPQSKEPSVEKEKPQSNGTTEEEQSAGVDEKSELEENHVIPESTSTSETTKVQETVEEPPQESPEKLTTEKPKSPEQAQKEAEEVQQPPQDKVEAVSVSPSVSDSVQDTESIPDPVPSSSPSATEASEPQPAPTPATPPTSVTEPEKSATPVTPQKETTEPEAVQSETDKISTEEIESPKDAPEADPLDVETASAAEKSASDLDKSVPEAEDKEDSEDNEGEEREEEPNEEAMQEENVDKVEDPLAKTPPKTPARKTKTVKPEMKGEIKTPSQKSPGKTKRQRMMTQHYQSPLPEIEIITKISSSTPRSKNNDDKLIYFYKNEFLAVRNAEGGFYLCQAVQNVYKSSSKIKIRWLSQDKADKSGEIYTPDFYDLTDFDCILTSLDLTKVGKGRYKLKPKEKERTDSILKRCLAVEKGEISQPSVSEEHPDGLDLSLYKDEEQLVKKKTPVKRKAPPRSESPKKVVPTKKTPETPKVRKVESKPSRTSSPSKKEISVKKTPEPKKTPASSRLARGKRKSDTKTSPVVDQKKAKVLAKIGRKSGVPASSPKPQATPKSAKSSKPTPSTSKATKPAPASSKPPPRKTKRSTRK